MSTISAVVEIDGVSETSIAPPTSTRYSLAGMCTTLLRWVRVLALRVLDLERELEVLDKWALLRQPTHQPGSSLDSMLLCS